MMFATASAVVQETLDWVLGPEDAEVAPVTTVVQIADTQPYSSQVESADSSGSGCVYPRNDSLNKKLRISVGDPCELAVDALLCFTNQNYQLSGRLLSICGNELLDRTPELESLRLGNCTVTPAPNIQAKHVIWTSGPRANSAQKHSNARDNALNSCFSNALKQMQEDKKSEMKSIATHCAFPGTSSVSYRWNRVLVRTLRYWLLILGDAVSTVVLNFASLSDAKAFKSLLILYFPRTLEEEEAASNTDGLLEEQQHCNKYGDTVVEERAIPLSRAAWGVRDEESDCDTLFESSTATFSSPRRYRKLDCSISNKENSFLLEPYHVKCLTAVKNDEILYNDLKRSNFFFPCGISDGMTVLLYTASLSPSSADHAVGFVVHELSKFAAEKFCIVFAGGDVSLSHPAFTALSGLLSVLENLDKISGLYFLFCGFMIRSVFSTSALLTSPRIFGITTYCESLKSLSQYFKIDKLALPFCILQKEIAIDSDSQKTHWAIGALFGTDEEEEDQSVATRCQSPSDSFSSVKRDYQRPPSASIRLDS